MAGITNSSGQILLAIPSFPAASINFTTLTTMGLWFNGGVNFTKGGGEIIAPFAGSFDTNSGTPVYPAVDNNVRLGQSGTRWHSLILKVGSLSTSHSDFKTDIQPLKYTEVPRGIQYRWKDNPDRLYWGFEADNLPKEAFAWKEDGSIDKQGIYTNSVLGVLCAAVHELQDDAIKLDSQLKMLEV